jgi:4-hydroxybenzoate polyprenyltransferase
MLGAIFTLATLFGLIFGLVLLFLPTVVARSRNHPNTAAIFLVNLLFGWTFIGWVVSLLWAYARISRPVFYAPAAYPAVQTTPQRPLVSAPVGTILSPTTSYGGRR